MVVWGGVIRLRRAFDAGLPVHHVEHPPTRHRGRAVAAETASGLRIRLPD